MTERSERVLIIDEGGLEGLLACLIAPTPSLATALFPQTGRAAPAGRLECVRRHTELLEMDGVLLGEPGGSVDLTSFLLSAGRAAIEAEASRLVWPLFVGDDTQAIAREFERARLVGELLCLDRSEARLTIETPFLDLDDRQLADLATDLDAPPGFWWPCDREGEAPCADCEGCRRWEEAFSHAGRLEVETEV